jgi:hypothetical protein
MTSTIPTSTQGVSAQGNAMRDFLFMLAPVALVIYFLIYPDQFNALLAWAGQYLH